MYENMFLSTLALSAYLNMLFDYRIMNQKIKQDKTLPNNLRRYYMFTNANLIDNTEAEISKPTAMV